MIATLAAADPAREVLIASTDQDYYQLLRGPSPCRGGVRVLNTAMRPGHRFIGAAQMTARYSVDRGPSKPMLTKATLPASRGAMTRPATLPASYLYSAEATGKDCSHHALPLTERLTGHA